MIVAGLDGGEVEHEELPADPRRESVRLHIIPAERARDVAVSEPPVETNPMEGVIAAELPDLVAVVDSAEADGALLVDALAVMSDAEVGGALMLQRSIARLEEGLVEDEIPRPFQLNHDHNRVIQHC